MIEHLPILGICGHSGAGKTTLLESIIPRLHARGLQVAVIKHDAHGLQIDQPGKDSDRLYNAGGDVFVNGPEQSFLRMHHDRQKIDPLELPRQLCRFYDLVLIEGHKSAPLPDKIWLLTEDETEPPPEAGCCLDVLQWSADRNKAALKTIDKLLGASWNATPVYAGVLIGGQSTRMGAAKHLIENGGRTWLEKIVGTVSSVISNTLIIGAGEIPRNLSARPVLPDVSGRQGPLAGMLAALRWQPFASWVFVGCDMPGITAEAIRWLLKTRAPGIWATLPKLNGNARVEPLLAHYDFRARRLLETCRRPADISNSKKVITPTPPTSITTAWQNINTPSDQSSP